MWPWLIVIAIVVLLYCTLSGKNSSSGAAKPSPEKRKFSEKALDFLPPIPRGFQIFAPCLSVAGIQYRLDDALLFADESDQALALEPEPSNPNDPNALRVIGAARGMRCFIGYVPKEVAEQIVGSGLTNTVQVRLERIWRSGNGYVDVTFQIIGPKDKKAQYDEFLKSKPAAVSQKEFLKFFGLPVTKGLTSEQADAVIIEHRNKLEAENKSQLDEWDAYEKICQEFDDADFRSDYFLKKVSRTLLKQALDDLTGNGATMRSLENDIDKVVEKVIALRPDIEKN